MTYSDADVAAAVSAVDKYRGGDDSEVGAALAVVGLSAERVVKGLQIRDDMIRVAHRAGASLRKLAEVTGLDRKTATAVATRGAKLASSFVRQPNVYRTRGPSTSRTASAGDILCRRWIPD